MMPQAQAKPGKLLLSPSDHTLILIDHQSQMTFATKSIDPVVLRTMVLPYPDPDARVNVAALRDDFAMYTGEKLIEGAVTVEQCVDGSFAAGARQRLGRYRGGA